MIIFIDSKVKVWYNQNTDSKCGYVVHVFAFHRFREDEQNRSSSRGQAGKVKTAGRDKIRYMPEIQEGL